MGRGLVQRLVSFKGGADRQGMVGEIDKDGMEAGSEWGYE